MKLPERFDVDASSMRRRRDRECDSPPDTFILVIAAGTTLTAT
ncbi:hypothetical protein [Burkholderia cepacia]|nr:hypothetical protein [Burkholderia cepacia]